MTSYTTEIEKYHALATLESGRGYLAFLDYVTVDAQPDKKPFRHIAEPWQWQRARRIAPALDHIAGTRKTYDGPLSFWNGYHKGSDKTHETARQLCWLMGWAKRRVNVVVCAGKEDQAGLITKAMRGILADNPWIAARVWVTELTAGGDSGSSVNVLSMNAYGNQGAFPDYIVAEEVTHWMHDEGRQFWESFVLASMNKRKCVVNVTTNAGMKGTWQWEERNRAATSRYWSFYEAPVGNPLPSWMDTKKIEDDSQGMMPGERDRLYKNRWVDPGEEHGYLTEAECLLCRDESLWEKTSGQRGTEYFVVVDYGGVHDRCSLGVMHTGSGGDSVIVDRLDCWQGTHENRIDILADPLRPDRRSVEGWLEVVRKNFKQITLVLDPYQLEALAIKYERMGTRVLRFEYRAGKANYRMAELLKTCIQNRRIRWSPLAGRLPPTIVVDGRPKHIEDTTLEKELAMLILKPTSYGYRFDHESGRYSDRAVTLGMGVIHALPEGVPSGPLGPTVVSNDKKTLPLGAEPSYRNEREGASVNRWGMYGMGGGNSAWERGDIT